MTKKQTAQATKRHVHVKRPKPIAGSYTRASVKRMIARYFPTANPDEILALLDGYGQESYEHERERVQTGILYLSEGHLDKLRQYIDLAKTDYRDLLMMAEFSHSK